ncbi:bifunctional diaminohydroxyphosphoribosylaminopyrimidine deaminase/5-amino-6-(5-phosphoribosylamino)uracil reductase RibD [Erythrobacter arachoides]|uniref:Riboflavin biosynthesis protein RibD n=1 Tax=Aurantiacibacter arachoides TaxID=1850444 RepID=A0A845A2E3_9SPHN|nr:bifunctional diaminohydroxyphosphoribosylaminopyrimidine deaminase/5-amino-6-(5-phosphoribosylamino)uracil reductase RibD [Aurantiacibacter arachoides]MXO94108.1 bifunctional diaminohydroxyphosphoribosylaminopyrimidine deaminase/5-amino-6-(5-phosphoribosylamino)uracil reductase RibD [Aurantiacibacter arachoides]GGD65988.1 riboflavin biosynthesis protein RibD [Aurantiacibacter arachoides]
MPAADDARWLAAAAALAERARPLSRPNPGVGAIIVKDGKVAGRGWTQPGGRPHAEAIALDTAGDAARGATLYVTLEPCAHRSERGPACADLVAAAGVAQVVIGMADPDARTAGIGAARLADSGVAVRCADLPAADLGLAGHECATVLGRPHVTLKLAMSLDGCIAAASGESKWITGDIARAHVHRERARADAILVGGGTLRTDYPALDVRLPGLETRAPERWVLTRQAAPEGWQALPSPQAIGGMEGVRFLFVEGGAGAAAAFLQHDLVDRLLLYRAPILIGGGRTGVGDIGLASLADAHGRWRREDIRPLGPDTLEIYTRTR